MISESRHIASSDQRISPWWNVGLKVVVSLSLIYLIYRQVLAKEDLTSFMASVQSQIATSNPLWLIAAILLIPFNFIFENMKWRTLLKGVQPSPFWTSMKAILCGSTLGIVTPNRLGEYGGRVLYINPDDNWKAVYATAVGNLAQMIILLTFGWIGALVFFNAQIEIPTLLTSGSIFLGIASLTLLCLLYFNVDIVIKLINRLPFLRRIKNRVRQWKSMQHLEILRSYDSSDLNKALGLGFLKYSVYTMQYLLLLYFFGIDVPVLFAIAGIASIYLIQTSIPLPAFVGLVARGELALLIWSYYSESPAHILGATFTLWVLNLLIPALIGLVLIYKVNILKSLGYD